MTENAPPTTERAPLPPHLLPATVNVERGLGGTPIADADTSDAVLTALLAELRAAEENKRQFNARADVQALDEARKGINATVNQAEERLRAHIVARAVQGGAISPTDPKADNKVAFPVGMGVQARQVVEYDPVAAQEWAMRHAPFLLTLNTNAFETLVMAFHSQPHAGKYAPTFSPLGVANVVRAITPIVGTPKPEASDDAQ